MRNWISSNTTVEDIVIASKITLARNFKEKLFTDKLKCQEARELAEEVYNIFNKKEKYKELNFTKIWEQDYNICKTYKEKYLITEELLKRKDRGAFITNKEETLAISINEEDHLKIQCIVDGLNLEEPYEYANKLDDYIEEEMSYAFHGEYGYLTACPSNVGTGMKASVIIHLPALTASEEISNISNGLNKVGMNIMPLYGEKNHAKGNIYEITNQITLGLQEEEIISNLQGVVYNIIAEEKKCREILQAKYKYELEDKVLRAYGILKEAKLLKESETLDLLSYMRLGIELGILDINKETVNKLLVITRNPFIDNSFPALDVPEKNVSRANIVKEILR